MYPILKFSAVTACLAAIALFAAFAAQGAPPPALAEESACEVHALGALSAEPDTPLTASGRWTTEDCDSRFRSGSDAFTYSFEVAEAGRVRIDLASTEADSFLYLMSEDGARITDNDDGASGLDARIELTLEPGSYLVEATTVGGRSRGPADFALSIARLSCDPIDLGVLVPGTDLTATGTWSIDTCGSAIVADHPAYNYTFTLAEPARVRIELLSEHGDPVLSLASPTRGVIGANDDGADGRGSRIEQYMPAGLYVIEATTYLQGDLQPLVADFELTVHVVDEAARQEEFLLKVEATLFPDQVIVGEPFEVDYRVGNIGGGDLPEDSEVWVYAVAPRVWEPIRGVPPELWQAGASYHSSSATASAVSTSTGELPPITVTFSRPGPSWVFVAVIAFDEDDKEIAFHGLWRTVSVVTGPTFGPVRVNVDGVEYDVVAADDDEGIVETWVIPVARPAAEVAPGPRAQATYAAAVQALVLDGVFERESLSSLATTAEPATVSLPNASSSTLLRAFSGRYVGAINALGVVDSFASGEAINPLAVEDLTLDLAATASAQYASLAASWMALQERIAGGTPISFAEARDVQVGVAYAERILAPAITAGEIVTAARAADLGWADPAVRAGLGALARQRTCDVGEPQGTLEAAAVEDIESFAELHQELAAALPVHALAVDAALCGVAGVDDANATFLYRLGVFDRALVALDAPDPVEAPEPPPAPEVVTPPPPSPVSLRIIARLADDGRVEHGVELGGRQVLPQRRFLGAAAEAGRWYSTSDVEVGGSVLGQISARWLADGRAEWRLVGADGEVVVPDVRFLPADAPAGVWFRSSQIEVAPEE
ncbi:MAG: PPC domain-containing protein [Chloroflexota bacterium]|nr:PPC domain-containing protein [Chloroflexota bacterium]